MFVQLQMFETKQRKCRVCGKHHIALSGTIQHFAPDSYVKGDGWAQALGFCSEFCFSLYAEGELDRYMRKIDGGAE